MSVDDQADIQAPTFDYVRVELRRLCEFNAHSEYNNNNGPLIGRPGSPTDRVQLKVIEF